MKRLFVLFSWIWEHFYLFWWHVCPNSPLISTTGLVAEGHSGVTRAPCGQPGQRHHGQHAAWHRTPAPPLHDGPQRQQHQAHHAAHRSPGPLPRPQLPAEEIHRLRAGNHWLCVSGPSVPDGERLFCSFISLFLSFLFHSVCVTDMIETSNRAACWGKVCYFL